MALTALIADDSIQIRDILRRQLERMGYLVVGEASNPEVALSLAGSTLPDLVMLDDSMPLEGGMSSVQALRAIALASNHTVIVVVLSQPRPAHRRIFIEAGAAYCLSKPFRLAAFEQLDRRVKSARKILRAGTNRRRSARNSLGTTPRFPVEVAPPLAEHPVDR